LAVTRRKRAPEFGFWYPAWHVVPGQTVTTGVGLTAADADEAAARGMPSAAAMPSAANLVRMLIM
jgi:hypothetical protein